MPSIYGDPTLCFRTGVDCLWRAADQEEVIQFLENTQNNLSPLYQQIKLGDPIEDKKEITNFFQKYEIELAKTGLNLNMIDMYSNKFGENIKK